MWPWGRRAPVDGNALPSPKPPKPPRVWPSWAVPAQLVGASGFFGGVYLQFGLSWAMIGAGAAVAAVGVLKEGGKI